MLCLWQAVDMKHDLILASFVCVTLVAAIACAPRTTSPQAGQALFAQNCAICHGSDARGGAQIPDLTGLALRADGIFPRQQVLEKLDGYARGQTAYASTQMPEFGHLLAGQLARVGTDDGLSRAYPEAIVAMAAWLERIQRQ